MRRRDQPALHLRPIDVVNDDRIAQRRDLGGAQDGCPEDRVLVIDDALRKSRADRDRTPNQGAAHRDRAQLAGDVVAGVERWIQAIAMWNTELVAAPRLTPDIGAENEIGLVIAAGRLMQASQAAGNHLVVGIDEEKEFAGGPRHRKVSTPGYTVVVGPEDR